jgi:hypothetical protein
VEQLGTRLSRGRLHLELGYSLQDLIGWAILMVCDIYLCDLLCYIAWDSEALFAHLFFSAGTRLLYEQNVF